MARLATVGFESQFLSTTVGSGPEAVIRNNSNTVISTSNARSGDACADCPDAVSNYIRGDWTQTPNRWFYTRAWIRISALPGADRNVATILDGATPVWTVVMKSDGKLYLSGHAAEGESSAVAANAYHCLEMGVWGDGSTDKRIKLRLDGTEFVDFSSALSPTLFGDQYRYGFVSGGNTGLSMKIDDVALNDDTGGAQDSWPDIDGKIVNLLPTADNAVGSDWKLGTGTTPSSNAFEAVNNVPPVGVSNGAAGSDAKQIRDTVNDITGPSADADFTMESYDDAGATGGIRVAQAVAALAQTSASNTHDIELGLVSNPSQTRPTVQIPAGVAGTFGAAWQSRSGGSQHDPTVTHATSPVVRVGKRQAATTALLCCYVALIVEYDPPTTEELNGSSAIAFDATGSLDSTVELSGSSATSFDAQAELTSAGALEGSAAIVFGASAVPPTGFANLVGSAAIQFDASGSLDAQMLFGSADIVFAATIVPPTAVAVLSGTAAVTFGGFGTLRGIIPESLPDDFDEAWGSVLLRPDARVQIRRGRFNRGHAPWVGARPGDDPDDMAGVSIPGIDESYNTNPWQATWEPYTEYVDVPNVREIRLDKSTQNRGLTTATLTIDNIVYTAEGVDDTAHHEIRRGFLSPLRGHVAEGRVPLVDEQGANVGPDPTWFGLLSRQAQITVHQSYGDSEVKTFTGLVDDVDATSRPDVITVTLRCFGQILTDERVFGWNKEPAVKDPVTFIDKDHADDVTTVGDDASSSSEFSSSYEASNVTDGDGDTFWLSAAHSTQGNTEWVEIRLPQGRYNDFYLNPSISGLDAYVCLNASLLSDLSSPTKNGDPVDPGWQGSGEVPGEHGGIPYVTNPTDLSAGGLVRTLGDEYVVGPDSILRIAFRNLQLIDLGDDPFGAGVVSLRGRRRKLVAEALTKNWVLVEDVSDIVKQILRWAGFKEWEIETAGVKLSKKWLANRGMMYMDVIQAMADAIGYTFFIGDPSADPNSIGVPVFRQTRAVQGVPAVITVTDRDLLNSIQVKQTEEPLSYIIRVRGRESADGQQLGGSSIRRVMYTFRPPWSHQLDEPLSEDRLGGVIKHVIHTDHLFRSVDDCKFGAYYIALQEALESVKASFEFPAHPGPDLDDHIDLLDLATGITSRVLLTDRSSTFVRTQETTQWTMTAGGALVDTPDVSDMVAIIAAAQRS